MYAWAPSFRHTTSAANPDGTDTFGIADTRRSWADGPAGSGSAPFHACCAAWLPAAAWVAPVPRDRMLGVPAAAFAGGAGLTNIHVPPVSHHKDPVSVLIHTRPDFPAAGRRDSAPVR